MATDFSNSPDFAAPVEMPSEELSPAIEAQEATEPVTQSTPPPSLESEQSSDTDNQAEETISTRDDSPADSPTAPASPSADAVGATEATTLAPPRVPDALWDIPANLVSELPPGGSFVSAIDQLVLPPIYCGKKFLHGIKLFTLTNGFAKNVQVYNVYSKNPSIIKAELNLDKTAVWLDGTPKEPFAVDIVFQYRKLSASENAGTKGSPAFEGIKKLEILPDPGLEINRIFQKNTIDINVNSDLKVGKQCELTCLPLSNPGFSDYITLLDCSLQGVDGLTTTKDNDAITITGTPRSSGPLSLMIRYMLKLFSGLQEQSACFSFPDIERDAAYDEEDRFIEVCKRIPSKRGMAGSDIDFILDLNSASVAPNIQLTSFSLSDPGLEVSRCGDDSLYIKGRPTQPGSMELTIYYQFSTYADGVIERALTIPVLQVAPDPKTLWRNLPTDPNAPYQVADQEHILLNGEKTVVGASKRGRSHAHDAKFRDDHYQVEYLEETQWYIIAVSDGAGSAEFSREGSRIACRTFCEVVKNALTAQDAALVTNTPENQDKMLRSIILKAAYQGMTDIDEEAKRMGVPRKKYSATLLAYAMKKIAGQWLIAAIGIGDGIIALLDPNNELTLLTTPDGGEFVGQTRFITMNEVWQDSPGSRVCIFRVEDFAMILSMTDGVSDPKFETDNNLKSTALWQELRRDLEEAVPLTERSQATAQALENWLDFWAKGNHDDRTIVLVY